MTDSEKVEKLLEYIVQIITECGIECENFGASMGDWCDVHCQGIAPTKECVRYFLLGEVKE